jgi:uncharacterized membrane protein
VSGEPTVIAGIPLPSDSPIFLSVLGIHVALGLACVVTGAIAMLSPKGPGRHPQLGTTYYWALAAVFGTASILSAMRWAETYHLIVLGALSFVAATLGRTARRRRWRNWVRVHIASLGASYVFLLTAFYVDNGPNLPLWNRLPQIAFWLLPAVVGAPLVLRALLRHPLARAERLRRASAAHSANMR